MHVSCLSKRECQQKLSQCNVVRTKNNTLGGEVNVHDIWQIYLRILQSGDCVYNSKTKRPVSTPCFAVLAESSHYTCHMSDISQLPVTPAARVCLTPLLDSQGTCAYLHTTPH